jgi:hypothetical protein
MNSVFKAEKMREEDLSLWSFKPYSCSTLRALKDVINDYLFWS